MIELARGRGRPSTANLMSALERSRQRNRDLREELTAMRAESTTFAQRVRIRIDRVKTLIATGADMAAINEAGKIGYDADRRLEQLGSVVL